MEDFAREMICKIAEAGGSIRIRPPKSPWQVGLSVSSASQTLTRVNPGQGPISSLTRVNPGQGPIFMVLKVSAFKGSQKHSKKKPPPRRAVAERCCYTCVSTCMCVCVMSIYTCACIVSYTSCMFVHVPWSMPQMHSNPLPFPTQAEPLSLPCSNHSPEVRQNSSVRRRKAGQPGGGAGHLTHLVLGGRDPGRGSGRFWQVACHPRVGQKANHFTRFCCERRRALLVHNRNGRKLLWRGVLG
jgi:hypothetical protein